MARPVYLQQRTYLMRVGTAVECQEATYALQQTAPLFDHLVGEREELCRHIEPERFGCLEIDH